jgi:hypothetical protein
MFMNNYRVNILTFVVGIVLSQCFWGCSSENSKIIGEWRGLNRDNLPPITLIFDKTNHAVVTIGSATVGGRNCVIEGRKIDLIYETNYAETPFTIDFTQIIDGVKSKYTFIKDVFRFVTEARMEMRMRVGDEERFKTFDSTDKENSVILERVHF